MSVQVINDKLQGSVATYLTCSGAANNQIRKSLLLNLSVNFLIGEYLAKLRSLFSSFSSVLTRCAKCIRQQRSCLKLCQIFNDLKKITNSKFIKESCSDFLNRLRFDRIVVMSLCGPISLAHPVGLGIAEQRQLQYRQGKQEAQLPQKNTWARCVNWNLVNYCKTVSECHLNSWQCNMWMTFNVIQSHWYYCHLLVFNYN